MEPIKDFEGLAKRFKEQPRRKRVVAVCPHDEPTIEVIDRCLREGVADFILVNDSVRPEIQKEWMQQYGDRIEIVDTDDFDSAAAMSVKLINERRAEVVFKGSINTDNLLRAVLDKEHGLLPHGRVMSHVAVADIPGYDKLLIYSDSAVIPVPNLDQFDAMVRHNVDMARRMGHTCPKVALVHFTEKVNKKFQCTLDYVELIARAAAGSYGEVEMGGPMDIKTALDPHSGQIKGIKAPAAGDADVVIMPDLEAANAFYKTLALFGGARIAALLIGTTAPVVTPSRADSADNKYFSLALACVAGHYEL